METSFPYFQRPITVDRYTWQQTESGWTPSAKIDQLNPENKTLSWHNKERFKVSYFPNVHTHIYNHAFMICQNNPTRDWMANGTEGYNGECVWLFIYFPNDNQKGTPIEPFPVSRRATVAHHDADLICFARQSNWELSSSFRGLERVQYNCYDRVESPFLQSLVFLVTHSVLVQTFTIR